MEKLSVFFLRFKRFFFLFVVNVEVIEREKNVLYLVMINLFYDLIIYNKLYGGICD